MSGKGSEKIKWKGSFTVEAAYILPLIVFLIWNILYLSFFLYDRSTLLQGSYCTALRTERLYGTEDEKTGEAKEKYCVEVEKKIVCAALSGEQEVTKNGVTVVSELDMKGPGGIFFQSSWHGRETQTADKYEPVAFIRKCRKVSNLGDLLGAGVE